MMGVQQKTKWLIEWETSDSAQLFANWMIGKAEALEAKLSELEEIIMANAQENLRLLSEIDDLEAKLSKTEELKQYVIHRRGCRYDKGDEDWDAIPCTCGLIEALAGGEEV